MLSYARVAVEKPSKTDNFHRFWPGLPNATADCFTHCQPIWLKFKIVNWIGYGYVLIEICRGVIRYVEAAVEKPAKIRSPGQELGLPVGVRSLVKGES